MRVLTIQSDKLHIGSIVYPNGECNYKHALPVYDRLFNDYNKRFCTSYKSFFWGFVELHKDNIKDEVYRALEMLQRGYDDNIVAYVLEVPDDVLLVTDFYNFSDEIFAYEFPNELKSNWENIYVDRDSEKQCIFPYILSDWVKQKHYVKHLI